MKIDIRLNDTSLAAAVDKMQRFQKKYEPANVALYVRSLVEVGSEAASGRLSGTDALSGETYSADLGTSVTSSGTEASGVISLNGTWAVFVEFGVGVKNNALPSLHPAVIGENNLNSDLFLAMDYGIGSYGLHQGLRDSWTFGRKEKKKAEGFRAQMPLYNAAEKIRDEYIAVAKEVFTNGSC